MASLPFQGFMCMVTDPVPCAGDPCYQQSVDLFRDGVNATVLHNCMIRFDPGKFNPAGASAASNFADQEQNTTNTADLIWEKAAVGGRLITALFEASHQQAGSGGCSLLSNGSKCRKGSRTTNHRYIYCNHYRKYDDSSKARKAIKMKKNKAGQSEPRGPFRRMTFCNNKKNSRPKGQSMIRRTTTFRPLSLVDGTCKVRTTKLLVLH
jgi:hypothetical protein